MDALTRTIYSAMRLRLAAIHRDYPQRAEELQYLQWQRVMRCLRATEYGWTTRAVRVTSPEQYADLVPLVYYEDLREYTERMAQGESNVLTRGGCDRFAISSGTSGGRSKYIPVNALHLQMCHFRGGSDALWLYLDSRPDSRFFRTKGLVLGGSQQPAPLAPGIAQGDLSSILIEKMPSLGSTIRVPSKETLLMADWMEKIPAIIAETRDARVGSLSGVPSWMLTLIKRLLEDTHADHLSQVWPELEVFFHGGISFAPYREEYKRLIPSPRMQYRETYNASEGFFGIQDDACDPAMLLMLDYGIYYEFIPLAELDSPSPKAIPLVEVEVGKTYALVISTLGGLYRYIIGDTIRFTQRNPYKFIIVGRTTSYINAFGEELMVCNADEALAQVCEEQHASIAEYTAAPYFDASTGKGRHDWLIEFSQAPQDLELFAQRLHEKLRQINSDYDAKSSPGMTLQPLKIYPAPQGTFTRYLQEQGKLGGQNKVPRLRNDRELFDALMHLSTQGTLRAQR